MTARRRTLPQRRFSETVDIRFWNMPWKATIGYFNDANGKPDLGAPGELFVNAAKTPGTDLDAMSRDAAILFSLCLQHGVSIETISGALTRNANGTPSTIICAISDQLLRK